MLGVGSSCRATSPFGLSPQHTSMNYVEGRHWLYCRTTDCPQLMPYNCRCHTDLDNRLPRDRDFDPHGHFPSCKPERVDGTVGRECHIFCRRPPTFEPRPFQQAAAAMRPISRKQRIICRLAQQPFSAVASGFDGGQSSGTH